MSPTAALAAPAPASARESWPTIIQGGMGVAVSSWRLARAVSRTGQLGVVSGTALDLVVARRLQDGDEGGHIRRALEHFPDPGPVERVLRRYYRSGGRAAGRPYTPVPKLALHPNRATVELSVVGNFAEVWLAKEGHDGVVGINLLEKVQMATPSAAYGAMLGGVDYVLMGAGIPAEIPRMLDGLARHEAVRISAHVDGATQAYEIPLDPAAVLDQVPAPLRRPRFLAIVSSHVLASYLAREEATRPDGVVIEGPPAGGHNAPPRGKPVFDEDGQPVFGPRDAADLVKVSAVGLPFWLAGGYATPERVAQALAAGAQGVQVGTSFALTADSGLEPALREELVGRLADGTLRVRTDALASPTGFPFKVATVPSTISEKEVYTARPRLCDLGYLRVPYERTPGKVGYRCPAEPVDTYVRKGGELDATVGRACLCNGLSASVGLGQTRADGYTEPALLTLGADVEGATQLLARHPQGWSAEQVVEHLLGR